MEDDWFVDLLPYTTGESQRVKNGPAPDEKPAGWLWTFPIQCPGNASDVLRRVREVLGVVLSQSEQDWPGASAWQSLLPDWFVEMCVSEDSNEYEQWHTLSDSERSTLLRRIRATRWSVLGWVASFHPGIERFWFWWDAAIVDSNTLLITLEHHEIIYAQESFRFLLWASGADSVGEEY